VASPSREVRKLLTPSQATSKNS